MGTEEESLELVRRGKVWGAMVFQANYSESLIARVESGRYVEDSVLDAASLGVTMDMSSKTLKTLT